MRRLLVSGLLLGLLVGCGTNAPENTELSKPERNNSTSERTPNFTPKPSSKTNPPENTELPKPDTAVQSSEQATTFAPKPSPKTNPPEETELIKPAKSDSTREQTSTLTNTPSHQPLDRSSPAPIPTEAPKSIVEPNSFDSVVFPQESCGDSNSDDSRAYPIELYPVITLIDPHSELVEIQSRFCGNAYLGQAPSESDVDFSTNIVVLGYFRTQERATYFQNIISNYLDNVKIGKPYKITQNAYKIARSAQLSKSALEEILSLDQNNRSNTPVKAIVPTYIPEGYQLTKFEIDENRYSSYDMIYQNKNNDCFRIYGSSGGWGDGARDYKNIEVLSPALGKINLEYTNVHRSSHSATIRFSPQAGLLMSPLRYYFYSPFGSCNSISVSEAIKVVESLQYLNPESDL